MLFSREQQNDWQIDFPVEIMKVKSQWNHSFKVLKENILLK